MRMMIMMNNDHPEIQKLNYAKNSITRQRHDYHTEPKLSGFLVENITLCSVSERRFPWPARISGPFTDAEAC